MLAAGLPWQIEVERAESRVLSVLGSATAIPLLSLWFLYYILHVHVSVLAYYYLINHRYKIPTVSLCSPGSAPLPPISHDSGPQRATSDGKRTNATDCV